MIYTRIKAKIKTLTIQIFNIRILAVYRKPFHMYLSRILLSFVLFTGLAAESIAQSAQDVVNKYLLAMGGKEKLQSINSLYQEGIAVLDNGAQAVCHTWRVYDRVYREEVTLATGKLVIVVTPRQGWSSGPGTGGLFRPMTDKQFKSMESEIDPGGPLVDYGAKGNKLEMAGRDTVNGQPCYKLRVYFPSGAMATYSIDARTGYILRANRHGGNVLGTIDPGGARDGGHPEGDVSIEYSDYKVIPGGYIFPYTITLGLYGAKVRISKIQVNGNVDPDVLGKPK
jgi:hypothetical protein